MGKPLDLEAVDDQGLMKNLDKPYNTSYTTTTSTNTTTSADNSITADIDDGDDLSSLASDDDTDGDHIDADDVRII